jgi:hypothetical protein
MLLFLASILSFAWRIGSEDDPSSRAPLSSTAILGPRVAITGVLVLGLVYLAMIVKTLMSYGRVGCDESGCEDGFGCCFCAGVAGLEGAGGGGQGGEEEG